MELKEIDVLLSQYIKEKNNDKKNKIKNKYINEMTALINSSSKVTDDEISIIIKGIDIDEGHFVSCIFRNIRTKEILVQTWEIIKKNKMQNNNRKFFCFLCIAMLNEYKDSNMNSFQWNQIMDLVAKLPQKNSEDLHKYEKVFRKYFLDKVSLKYNLPDIKKIASNNSKYDEFVRFILNIIESKYIKDCRISKEKIEKINNWLSNTVKKDNEDKKNNHFNSNNENRSKGKIIVMNNQDNTNDKESKHMMAYSSSSEYSNNSEKKSNIQKQDQSVKELDEIKNVSGEDKRITESEQDTVFNKKNKQEIDNRLINDPISDINNKPTPNNDKINDTNDNNVVDDKNLIEKNTVDAENTSNKKSSEKTNKKSKKQSGILKKLAEYFEKLENDAEKNEKVLLEKDEEIESSKQVISSKDEEIEALKQVISSKDGEIEELYSEIYKLKSRINILLSESSELEKKLDESMKMNLSFETIKASREEDIKMDIANSLRNIYEDYTNSVDEKIDDVLGEIYREKIGEIFSILDREGVKVEN